MGRLSVSLFVLVIFVITNSIGYDEPFIIRQITYGNTKNFTSSHVPSVYSNTIAWMGWDYQGGHTGSDWDIYYYDGTDIINISDNAPPDGAPSVYNSTVAWHGWDGHDYEIYYWDGTQIINVSNNDTFDTFPSLYNGAITWMGYDTDGNETEIYYWDGHHTTQVTHNSTQDYYPSLYNDTLAWRGWDGNDSEIYYWDSENIVNVSNNDTNDYSPSLYNGTIAWVGMDPNVHQDQIYYWDGINIINVSKNTTTNDSPSLYNGTIVWRAWEGDSEIYYWNGSEVVNVSDNNSHDDSPSLHNGFIAWRGMVNDYYEIYLAEPSSKPPVYQVELSLTKGINIISLPLEPGTPYTASTLAEELGATLVMRYGEGEFQAYLPDVHYIPFPIEVGKGYIVNLLEDIQFSLIGRAWGTPVPAAPSTPTTGKWAFVVAGSVSDGVQKGATILITNHRSGQTATASVAPSGQFTAAFVDMSRQSVVNIGDEVSLQVLDHRGNSIGQAQRHRITPEQLARAYLLSTLSILPTETRLLPNYPNPFNPETRLPYQLSDERKVIIRIYDIKGQIIRVLDLGQRETGYYVSKSQAAYWNGRDATGESVSSGVYFYQLKAGDFSAVRKMVIMK